MNRFLRLCLAASTAAVLAACGGGSDDAKSPLNLGDEPDSATASVKAFTEFTGALVADEYGAQTARPLTLSTKTAPVSESAAPMPVN